MPDWTKSMQQSFEYYTVDPGTWKDVKLLQSVKVGSSISRDSETETLGSATINTTESIGECYIRIYLVTIQNGLTEKHPLGTFLVQTQPSSFDGKMIDISVDAYTPLLELKEKPMPLGYSLLKSDNIMENAYLIAADNMRAPVVKTTNDKTLFSDFVANADDTYLAYLYSLISNAKYTLELDELGRVLFSPIQELASLQPVWTYDDSNSSILYPEITTDKDLYGIPNVVEVVYSNGRDMYHARVVNDDPNSPVSTISRGREILYRDTNPSLGGDPSDHQVQEYAKQLLKALSTLQCTVTYTHGYCPVRLGDCVRLNHPRAGLNGVKAKVISQNIKCEPGCPVSEKAVYTAELWR